MNFYTCPVCGYNYLKAPPQEGTICPSCGTQFGYHDFSFSHSELRQRWLANGAQWWSRNTPPPVGWDPHAQVQRATNGVDVILSET